MSIRPRGELRQIGAEELRALLAKAEHHDLTVVDVRSPEEYASGHLPGAKLIPLQDFELALDDLDDRRTHVFYCHSGIRSLRAAAMASRARGIVALNLLGGIIAWRGDTLEGVPNLSVFGPGWTMQQVLAQALELERGAEQLYAGLAGVFADTPVGPDLAALASAERAHAGVLERRMSKLGFDATAAGLEGDSAPSLFESGEPVAAVTARLMGAGSAGRIPLLELALELEYRALDLYSNLGQRASGAGARAVFEELAAQEKRHAMAIVGMFAEAAGG